MRADGSDSHNDRLRNVEVGGVPMEYKRRFHYDTIAHDRGILLDLVRLVGADRVVCGTDFPADMSDVAPVPTVDKLTELSAREREMILGGNAARLFKL